jgi:hypothetical protein
LRPGYFRSVNPCNVYPSKHQPANSSTTQLLGHIMSHVCMFQEFLIEDLDPPCSREAWRVARRSAGAPGPTSPAGPRRKSSCCGGSLRVLVFLGESFEIERSRPHGHEAAVLGCVRHLGVDVDRVAAKPRTGLTEARSEAEFPVAHEPGAGTPPLRGSRPDVHRGPGGELARGAREGPVKRSVDGFVAP